MDNLANKVRNDTPLKRAYLQMYYSDLIKDPEVKKPDTWSYSLRDLFDEFIILVVLLAAALGVWFLWLPEENGWENRLAIALKFILFASAIAWGLYVAGVFLLRRMFVEYILTSDTLSIKEGFFVQRNQNILLLNILQVDTRRTLWERIIHVGTLSIRYRDGMGKYCVYKIRGLARYQEMREKLDKHRNFVRIHYAVTN
ncbi:MAG: PH domain-containing protein [Planctomycetia bacterium]|nr:PH domain-containing protein [Planctomycetia bacterium]